MFYCPLVGGWDFVIFSRASFILSMFLNCSPHLHRFSVQASLDGGPSQFSFPYGRFLYFCSVAVTFESHLLFILALLNNRYGVSYYSNLCWEQDSISKVTEQQVAELKNLVIKLLFFVSDKTHQTSEATKALSETVCKLSFFHPKPCH